MFWFVLVYLYSFLLHWTDIKLTNDNVFPPQVIYKPWFSLFWRTKEITFKVWLCVSIDPFPNRMEIAMIRMLFWISQSHKQQNTEMLLEKGAALLPFTYFTFTMPICDLQMQHKNCFELIHVVKGEGISQNKYSENHNKSGKHSKAPKYKMYPSLALVD